MKFCGKVYVVNKNRSNKKILETKSAFHSSHCACACESERSPPVPGGIRVKYFWSLITMWKSRRSKTSIGVDLAMRSPSAHTTMLQNYSSANVLSVRKRQTYQRLQDNKKNCNWRKTQVSSTVATINTTHYASLSVNSLSLGSTSQKSINFNLSQNTYTAPHFRASGMQANMAE